MRYVRLSVVDKARALEKMPDFHPGKPESESMRATGTDDRNAAESVDTQVDTDRGDKGLFQAMNCYNAGTIKPAEIGGRIDSQTLENIGVKIGGDTGFKLTAIALISIGLQFMYFRLTHDITLNSKVCSGSSTDCTELQRRRPLRMG